MLHISAMAQVICPVTNTTGRIAKVEYYSVTTRTGRKIFPNVPIATRTGNTGTNREYHTLCMVRPACRGDYNMIVGERATLQVSVSPKWTFVAIVFSYKVKLFKFFRLHLPIILLLGIARQVPNEV